MKICGNKKRSSQTYRSHGVRIQQCGLRCKTSTMQVLDCETCRMWPPYNIATEHILLTSQPSMLLVWYAWYRPGTRAVSVPTLRKPGNPNPSSAIPLMISGRLRLYISCRTAGRKLWSRAQCPHTLCSCGSLVAGAAPAPVATVHHHDACKRVSLVGHLAILIANKQ